MASEEEETTIALKSDEYIDEVIVSYTDFTTD